MFSGLSELTNNETVKLIQSYIGLSPTIIVLLIAVISIWALVWKGIALWKASKKNHLIWFVILLVVNTLGILEILYIYVFSKMMDNMKSQSKVSTKKIKKKRK